MYASELPPHEENVRVVLRPIATPLPLGFLGLAGASLLLSGVQLKWVDVQDKPSVGLALIAFPALLQLIVAIAAFAARDVVAATAMAVLGATWLGIGLILEHAGPTPARNDAVAMLSFTAAIALLVPIILAATTKALAAVVLGTADVRFVLTGIHQAGGVGGWADVSGWVGIALLVLATVAAMAFALEDQQGHPVGWTLRTSAGTSAFTAPVRSSGLEHEAGVRRSL